jgi:hypothetical protein
MVQATCTRQDLVTFARATNRYLTNIPKAVADKTADGVDDVTVFCQSVQGEPFRYVEP